MDRVDIAQLTATADHLQVLLGLPHDRPAPLRAVNILELGEHQFPERVQLLGPLLHAGDLGMVFAGRGVGKTQICLAIGTALAFGGVFLRWQAARPVGVLYLDAEMAGAVMQQRVASFLPDEAPEDLSANLRLFTPDLLPEGQALPDLSTVDGQQMVEPLIDATTRVLIIDNVSAWCRTGKENESESWTPVATWLLTLRRRGIAVLLVHHAGKNGEQRGNSKKEDLLDIVIQLKRAGDYDPRTGAAFTWAVTKGRHLHGEDAAELDLTLTITDGVARWQFKEAEASNVERVVALANEGLSCSMIAEQLGINRSTAWRVLKKQGMLPAKGTGDRSGGVD
ncbi:MAG TPA: AAA family ATPase [Caldimonas sp.]|jgi:putative DNA primase/helicase|nr:AAA family ATPase [Caldimonas sp.]HEX2541497.1 AAA family ATPase [Caldimonas sp.]